MDKPTEFPIVALESFPGFAVQYNPKEHLYFKKNIEEALEWVSKCELGKNLFKEINASIPQNAFANGIKCIFLPMNIVYHPAGKIVRKAQEGSHPFTGEELAPEDKDKLFVKDSALVPNRGYCCDTADVQAVDTKLTSNEKGSVCYMNFSNAFFVDNKGNENPTFIVLAHELIHVLHNCTGTNHASDEEIKTVGLGKYANEKYTENKFRDEFKIDLR